MKHEHDDIEYPDDHNDEHDDDENDNEQTVIVLMIVHYLQFGSLLLSKLSQDG